MDDVARYIPYSVVEQAISHKEHLVLSVLIVELCSIKNKWKYCRVYLDYHDHIKYVIIKLTLKSTIEFQTKKRFL